jgi:hypothetical protein
LKIYEDTMKLSNKLLLTAIAVFLTAGSLMAQGTFENNGGTYEASCTAILRVLDNGAAAPFTTEGGGDPNDVLGAVNPIEGIVEYAQDDGNPQTVQAVNYSYLFLASTTSGKIIPATGVIVHGDGTCDMTSLAGGTYDDLTTYPYSNGGTTPTYQGEFTYQPATGVTQNVFPDDYNELVLSGDGISNILTGDVLTADIVTTGADNSLTLSGDLTAGTGASILDGDVTIADGGDFTGGTGDITFNNTLDLVGTGTFTGDDGLTTFNDIVTLTGPGAVITTGGTGNLVFDNTVDVTDGSLTIPDGGAGALGTLVFDDDAVVTLGTNGNLDIGTNGNVLVTGSLTNDGDGTNLDFDCTSIVTYDGSAGQLIMPTLTTHRYGNLVLTTGNKDGGTASYGNDVSLCQVLTMDEVDLDMTAPADLVTPQIPGALIMTGADYDIAHSVNGVGGATHTSEIIGEVSRTGFNVGDQYFFNNAYTYATFEDLPTTSFTLSVEPSTQPTLIDYDNNGDYDRNIVVSYNSTSDVTLQNLALGYEYSEITGDPTKQNQVRLVEGYNAGNRGQLVGVAGAIIGLSGSATTANGEYASVLFDENSSGNYLTFPASGTEPGNPDEVFNSNSLVMTTAPVTLISMRNGRWSDPGTWGGVTPTSQDHAQIAHVVYTGIFGQNNDNTNVFGNPAYAINEQTLPGVDGGVIASYVEIDPNDVSGTRPVALVIGGEDDDMGPATLTVGTTTYANATFTGVWNKNTTANAWDGTTLTATTGIHGIYVMSEGAFVPTIRMKNGRNEGSVVNNAVIELGE